MLRKLYALLTLALLACTQALAAPIVYEFKTTLALVGGADGAALDGKIVEFKAVLPDGAVYGTKFGIPAVEASSSMLTVSGGSAVDGDYALNADWYPGFSGWFNNGNFFNVGGFTTAAIWHFGTPTSIGDAVDLGDWGGLNNVASWIQSDGSSYDWFRNAEFRVYEQGVSAVPLPGALSLLPLALLAAAGFSRRRA